MAAASPSHTFTIFLAISIIGVLGLLIHDALLIGLAIDLEIDGWGACIAVDGVLLGREAGLSLGEH